MPALAALAVVTLIHLGAQAVAPGGMVADVTQVLLMPLLKTRGFSSLPVHVLGKAATFALLYALPLVLLGAGDSAPATAARAVGWASANWGTGLYWWAGLLYVRQTADVLRRFPRVAVP